MIKGYLPLFDGLYDGSISDGVMQCAQEYLDDDVESYVDGEPLQLHFTDSMRKEIGEYWVEHINNKLGVDWLKFTFEKMTSPRFYNYSTDVIDCDIECDVEALMTEVDKKHESFNQYCQDNFTSHPGFHSFFPNTAHDYLSALREFGKNSEQWQTYISHIIDWFVCDTFDTTDLGVEMFDGLNDIMLEHVDEKGAK